VSVVKKEVEIQSSVNENRFYSPLVLNIAKEEKISMTDLEKIAGTGKDGRLTKNDLLDYLAKRTQNPVTETLEVVEIKQEKATEIAKVEPVQSTNKPAVSYSGSSQGRVEVMEMDRMRKMIAQRMVESKHTSPHVTSFVEADVTGIVNWRKAKVEAFKKKEGINLTYTPIFIWAVVKAIKDFPLINSSIDGDKILIKKDINIGVAVALPSGNLIVPVIKNAEHLNLSGLAIKIDDLAKRARENKLSPDELSGGTYTVSNIGSFGNLMGTPIILQPQVAILSLGAIVKKPAVIETPEGDLIGIRQKMFLSHSYDHRIIDGALGGMFVRKVADYLEQFDVKQSI
ncbi:MAG: 2-oxo acid dehydrogenase subunit E2, partial [Bacteroidetes bacterium]